jgi:type 1 fimbria pilin
MTGLSLTSINPITVTYSNSTLQESWTVDVGLSIYKASTGSMTISAGGTFDSSLKVWPRFTFRRIPDNKTLVLDTGSPTGPGLMAASQTAVIDDSEITPGPEPAPTVAPAPCSIVIGDIEGTSKTLGNTMFATASSSSSCSPVTLTSTNSPWGWCPTGFCIPRPITEQELLASHNASPKGTKKAQAAKSFASGE